MNDAIGTKRSQQSAPAKSEPEYTAKVSAPNSQSGPQLDDQPSLRRTPSAQRVGDEERIRQRAYELYAEGRFQEGNAERDWLAAEREILDGRRC